MKIDIEETLVIKIFTHSLAIAFALGVITTFLIIQVFNNNPENLSSITQWITEVVTIIKTIKS